MPLPIDRHLGFQYFAVTDNAGTVCTCLLIEMCNYFSKENKVELVNQREYMVTLEILPFLCFKIGVYSSLSYITLPTGMLLLSILSLLKLKNYVILYRNMLIQFICIFTIFLPHHSSLISDCPSEIIFFLKNMFRSSFSGRSLVNCLFLFICFNF